MKFMVLSCLLASAIAAPSGVAPIIAPIAPVLLTAAPTVDPGDLEAAAINAKVFTEDQTRLIDDQARHLSDQAREFSEQAKDFSEQTVEVTKDKTIELSDQVKEKSGEAFWSVEEKKWQALDAVKTAEAKLDGAVASNADNIAKSAFGVVVPFAPAPAPITPIVSPIQPILTPLVYNPLIKPEIKEDEKKEDAITKTIEGDKKEEKMEGEKKPAEFEKIPLTFTPFFVGSVAPIAPGFKLGQPILPAPLVALQYGLPTPLLNQW